MLWVYLFLINFKKGGCIKCDSFLISKGNIINFTHIIVDYMGKQHVESLIRNTARLLHNRATRITPIFHENGLVKFH